MRGFRKRRTVEVYPAEAAARKLGRMMYFGRREVAAELRRLADGELSAVRDLVMAEADRLEAEAVEADLRIDSAAYAIRHEEFARRSALRIVK